MKVGANIVRGSASANNRNLFAYVVFTRLKLARMQYLSAKFALAELLSSQLRTVAVSEMYHLRYFRHLGCITPHANGKD